MKPSRTLRPALAAAFAVFAMGLAGSAFAAASTNTYNLSADQHDLVRATANAAAIKAVPAGFHFVDKDTLTVGMAVAFPPLSTYATDGKTVVGFDPELAQLVADSLGRKLKIVPLAWEDWPLAVQSGKVDAVISNVTVTEERKQKFDFSTYRRDVLGFYVTDSSPIRSIKAPKDVAGLRVITDSGTNQEKILLAWDKENVAHGLKPVQIQYYDDPAVRDVALRSGRADVILSVNSGLAYAAAQRGGIRSVGTISGGWPIQADVAITTRKGSGLDVPLTLLLNDLIQGGKYSQVLNRWHLGDEAVDKAQTNPPGLPKS
ncbi:ABC transporter substrate-binding protein [Paraburkholderia sp. BCC1886]|uniref:ABC transporter substrate-binding protein n=1 Tax=Paraburkholderia sp. BCC1886 TaxID=2562670 RepID=UPI0011844701|nr:ABC transporter substrate-binding protein [Paraburkholderia sp. BCC1886]